MADPNKTIDTARRVLYRMRMFPSTPDSIKRDRRLRVTFEQWQHALDEAVATQAGRPTGATWWPPLSS